MFDPRSVGRLSSQSKASRRRADGKSKDEDDDLAEGGGGEERFIEFDGEKGTMKISGGPQSEFAKEIRGLVEFWVDGKGQVPCFLAAMTLEFWEKYGEQMEEERREKEGKRLARRAKGV